MRGSRCWPPSVRWPWSFVARSLPVVEGLPTMKPWTTPRASGSLLVTDCRVKPAGPEPLSLTSADTVTGINLLLGGDSVFGVALQVMRGGTVSIRTVASLANSRRPLLSTDQYLTVRVPPSRVKRVVKLVPDAGADMTASRPSS